MSAAESVIEELPATPVDDGCGLATAEHDPRIASLAVLDHVFGSVDLTSLTRDALFAKIDDLERLMAKLGLADLPLEHRFTPGLYSRTMHAPAGTIITSRVHKTEHQYVVSKGHAMVFSHGSGWVSVAAPFIGVTTPGTRRIIVTVTDLVWTTFHATDRTDPDEWIDASTEPVGSHLAGVDKPVAVDAETLERIKGDSSWRPLQAH